MGSRNQHRTLNQRNLILKQLILQPITDARRPFLRVMRKFEELSMQNVIPAVQLDILQNAVENQGTFQRNFILQGGSM